MRALQKEIFCLKTEVSIMADAVFKDRLERIVPGFAHMATEVEHFSRYLWMAKYVEGKKVMDIASGSGYGSYILLNDGKAESVLGCDIDETMIRYAGIKYKTNNLDFLKIDAHEIDINDKFDVVVSFETIEHLNNPENFLEGVNNILEENGLFVVSTPIKIDESDVPTNPFHVKEWDIEEFKEFLSKYFDIVDLFIQYYDSGSSSRQIVKSFLKRLHIFHMVKKIFILVNKAFGNQWLVMRGDGGNEKFHKISHKHHVWPQIKNIKELKKGINPRDSFQILVCKKRM